jgi:hypothetical protein
MSVNRRSERLASSVRWGAPATAGTTPSWNDSSGRSTMHILPTPVVGEVLEEIEVTDPRHPLFGQRFKVHAITGGDVHSARIYVRYCGDLRLMILREATNLSILGRNTPCAKLNTSSVEEFVALVKEYELCPSSPAKSGNASRQQTKQKSSPQ